MTTDSPSTPKVLPICLRAEKSTANYYIYYTSTNGILTQHRGNVEVNEGQQGDDGGEGRVEPEAVDLTKEKVAQVSYYLSNHPPRPGLAHIVVEGVLPQGRGLDVYDLKSGKEKC